MTDKKTLELMCQAAILTRINGAADRKHIIWSAKDEAAISDYIMASAPERIIRSVPASLQKFSDGDLAAVRRRFAKAGIVRAMQPDDRNFLGIISTGQVDGAGDVCNQSGIDCSVFNKNPAVLGFHDSMSLPVASSTPPWLSGSQTLAIMRFPEPGVSDESDRVAAAIRAGLVRGLSIGFQPLSWSFSKDPARPLGIDFKSLKLLEFSVCSLPCNPGCSIIGSAASGKSASEARTLAARAEAISAGEGKIADLRREVAAAAARVERIPDPPPASREQRLAQARDFRRIAAGLK
jgi:Caudovirus prohead serine protease